MHPDFSKAVAATNLVVAVLGKLFLKVCFDDLQVSFVNFGHGVKEGAFFEIEYGCGVNVGAVEFHFEMKVGSERTAGVSTNTNCVAGLQRVADVDLPTGEVCVQSRKAVPVVEDDVLAVTFAATHVANF